MEIEEELKKALNELRKEKKRKFNQTIDLIVNLQKFDIKKNFINAVINIPYKIKDKKIAAFLEVKNDKVDTITPEQFKKYSNKKYLKTIVKQYDFFISQDTLMPKVATTFGRVLGPAGKMPSPQIGILTNPDNKNIEELKNKINSSIRIKTKETSIKIPVGKENMKNEEIIENIMTIYNSLLKLLPKNKENIKNIEIKLTMSKPQKIKIK